MLIRTLAKDEVGLIRRIDRSEVVDRNYLFKDGKLTLVEKHFDISNRWWQEERVAKTILPVLEQLHDDGGIVYGAFEGSEFAGIASLDPRLRGNRAVLGTLFVSKPFRGRGIARALVESVKAKAKEIGASHLYVSAIPSEHTVGFYLSCGFKVADIVEPDLFSKEPEDIHMAMDL